jgi:hypothetical protein
MHFLISILLSTAFAATDDVKPIEPIEPIERNLIYPLMVEARAGAKANYWNPESIPGTKIATQGYATAYAEARVSLFEYLALERLRFESTVGTTGLDRSNPAGCLQWPVDTNQDKIVAHDSFDEDREESEMMSPAGSSHRFVTEFQQETYGIIARKTETNGFGHVMVGLGHLKFKKPWSPSFVENEYIFFSTMEAYGMAMSGDFHTQNDKFFNKYFKVDFLFGLGDIQLTETQNLADILDDDYGLGCVAGGVTAGIERDWIDIDGIDLYTTIFAGAWGDHFYIYNEDDSDDKTIPLTSDLRVSLGGEVRAMF